MLGRGEEGAEFAATGGRLLQPVRAGTWILDVGGFPLRGLQGEASVAAGLRNLDMQESTLQAVRARGPLFLASKCRALVCSG